MTAADEPASTPGREAGRVDRWLERLCDLGMLLTVLLIGVNIGVWLPGRGP